MNDKLIHAFLLNNSYTIEKYYKSEYSPFQYYGKATKGMVSVSWNEDGNYIAIRHDAGTRIVFTGIVNNIDELELIFKLVR